MAASEFPGAFSGFCCHSVKSDRLMLLNKPYSKALKALKPTSQNPIFSVVSSKFRNPPCTYIQILTYVDVYMKWKKDPYFDSIDHIHKSVELKSVVCLKDVIARESDGSIPVSAVSKRGLEFGVRTKVARFLRQYPSIFEEFAGPQYNLPWFRLTKEAAEIDLEERRVFEECKDDMRDRLKKFIMMSKEKMLPLKIIQGMLWYIGLPEDFLQYPDKNLDGSFKLVELDDGLKGLAVGSEGKFLSVLQRNAMKKGLYFGDPMEAIEFPLFPSKGLRLRRKIEDWLKQFQKVPYVSPYEDYSHLDPSGDIAEKRLVGFLHELLCLFVEHSVERKKLLCLKKYFGLPQKVHKAFERHPHIFYLSLKNRTCTAILKEAYRDKLSIERHPMLRIRNKYINLMQESEVILKRRRVSNRSVERPRYDLDLDSEDEDSVEMVESPEGLATAA